MSKPNVTLTPTDSLARATADEALRQLETIVEWRIMGAPWPEDKELPEPSWSKALDRMRSMREHPSQGRHRADTPHVSHAWIGADFGAGEPETLNTRTEFTRD